MGHLQLIGIFSSGRLSRLPLCWSDLGRRPRNRPSGVPWSVLWGYLGIVRNTLVRVLGVLRLREMPLCCRCCPPGVFVVFWVEGVSRQGGQGARIDIRYRRLHRSYRRWSPFPPADQRASR